MAIRKGVRLFQILLILTLSVLFSGTGFATTIYVDAVRSAVTSADMSSMDVTVYWTYAGSNHNETYDWGVSGVGADWGSLVIDPRNTYDALWTLTENFNHTITSITLTGNDVLFDIYFEEYLTTGSYFGFFGSDDTDWVGTGIPSADPVSGDIYQNNSLLFTWTASNPVALKGTTGPEYDLWNTLDLNFGTDGSVLVD